MTPWLSVVIVNWNARDALRTCLQSLRRQTERDVEVIVVDNGSTDGSADLARRIHPTALLVEMGRNRGFAEGCNRGIERSRAPWILTLNNDTEAPSDLLARLRAAAERAGATVGMLQPRVVFRERRTRLNSTGVVVHRDGSAHDRDFEQPLGVREIADEVMCVTAGAGLFRRAMLDATRLPSGYFDPHYFMYFEDVDLGWRCRLAGWTARYVPDACVYHTFQASSRRRGPYFVTAQCMRNRVRTLLKNGSLNLLVRSLPRSASDLLWLLQHAGGRALAGWLGAAWSALRQRADVTRIARLPRRTIEKRWLIARPR